MMLLWKARYGMARCGNNESQNQSKTGENNLVFAWIQRIVFPCNNHFTNTASDDSTYDSGVNNKWFF